MDVSKISSVAESIKQTILLVPEDLWQKKKPRNSIKVVLARSGTNLNFQLTSFPNE